MVFDRYNDVWIIVSPQILGSLIKRNEYVGSILGIAVRSETDIDELVGMMTGILLSRNIKICLWVDEKICHEHEQKIARILFLLYSTDYLFQYGKALMCLVGKHREFNNGARSHLEELVGNLGFVPLIKEIQGWDLSGIYDGHWFLQADHYSAHAKEIFSFYKDELTKNSFVGQDIFIVSTGEENILKILEAICEAEKTIRDTSPQLHKLYQHYRLVLKQHESLSNANKQLETDLANQKKYLAVLRKENEMEKIIEFYHGEYEVLPLWYKRFGHVLKILTGKRKIRSNHNKK